MALSAYLQKERKLDKIMSEDFTRNTRLTYLQMYNHKLTELFAKAESCGVKGNGKSLSEYVDELNGAWLISGYENSNLVTKLIVSNARKVGLLKPKLNADTHATLKEEVDDALVYLESSCRDHRIYLSEKFAQCKNDYDSSTKDAVTAQERIRTEYGCLESVVNPSATINARGNNAEEVNNMEFVYKKKQLIAELGVEKSKHEAIMKTGKNEMRDVMKANERIGELIEKIDDLRKYSRL